MLNKNIDMLNKNWSYVELSLKNSTRVPKASGIYMVVKLRKRIANVPLGLEVLYVGRAEKNIRSRFLDYTNVLGHHNNELLNLYLNNNLEFWFIEFKAELVEKYEAILINDMSKHSPQLVNKIRYKNKFRKVA